MIKLTLLITDAGNYDPETKMVTSYHSLRSMYVNPAFIVTMNENVDLRERHKRTPLIKDLIPEARFTKIAISGGIHGTAHYNILGTPEQNLNMIREASK